MGGRTVWTYATRGMSQPGEARPIELHMFAPRETTEVVELLFATAHFHRTEAPLDVGHSVHFGKPWLGRSACHYGLVSLPYLDGPALEIFQAGAATVHCYWLIPVTASEVQFKKDRGLEALEEKFDLSGFDYADPGRKGVA